MTFLDFLTERLTHPLPGKDAHRELMPPLKNSEDRLGAAPEGARRSAVLVPLVDTHGELPSVLLEVRGAGLSTHRGQISFPGGRLDAGETPVQAAIRELEEEVGIPAENVRILGTLSPLYIPPSNSAVTPILGSVQITQELRLSAAEVAEVLLVPLADLLHEESMKREPWQLYGTTIDVPHWHVHPHVPLWGATAMILNELLWLTQEYLRR